MREGGTWVEGSGAGEGGARAGGREGSNERVVGWQLERGNLRQGEREGAVGRELEGPRS